MIIIIMEGLYFWANLPSNIVLNCDDAVVKERCRGNSKSEERRSEPTC